VRYITFMNGEVKEIKKIKIDVFLKYRSNPDIYILTNPTIKNFYIHQNLTCFANPYYEYFDFAPIPC